MIGPEENTERKLKNCKYCGKMTKNEQHLRACGLYSKFIKKIPKGFQCAICSLTYMSSKGNVHTHIRNKHPEEFMKNKEKFENMNETEDLESFEGISQGKTDNRPGQLICFPNL